MQDAKKSEERQLSESILEQISETITTIHADLREKSRLKMIRREWEQLARIVERMLMVFFIMLTFLFAVLMLSSRDKPIVLTDQLMSTAND